MALSDNLYTAGTVIMNGEEIPVNNVTFYPDTGYTGNNTTWTFEVNTGWNSPSTWQLTKDCLGCEIELTVTDKDICVDCISDLAKLQERRSRENLRQLAQEVEEEIAAN